MKVNQLIKTARELKGLTMKQVAERVGVNEGTISRWESGEIENMKRNNIISLAKVLDLKINQLMGWEEIEEKDFRSISVPMLGRVAAGTPILAEQNIEDYFYIDRTINADFCLEVKGESMIEAGIYDSDIVFIKKQCSLENGQIGAILIENEATIKTFYRQKDTIILQPANKDYSPIILTEGNVRILGKVVATLNLTI